MSSYAKRIAALVQQIQEAEEQNGLSLLVALLGEQTDTGKWEVHAQLRNGSDNIETQVTEFDTQEEAEKAVDELTIKYAPTGKKQQAPTVCNVVKMEFCC